MMKIYLNSTLTLTKISVTALSGIILLFLSSLFSCSTPANHNDDYFSNDPTEIQVGGVKVIPIETPKGKFKVWTKRIGNNPKIKVLLMAGGPGAGHEYFEVFENFFPKESIEFYYYDQLGTGNSDRVKDPDLFDLPRSVEELEQVRRALHLEKDNFYLYGQSWGGMVAMEYALKYQQNLKALIISNMDASSKDCAYYAEEVLFKQLPAAVQDTMKQFEAKGDYNNPKYKALLMENFYARFICRLPLDQWPDPLIRGFAGFNTDYYSLMQGPSELHLSGKLKDWDIKARLPEITVPVLTIGAKWDEMNPEHMKWMAAQVKNGQFLYCANGSHMSLYDDQQTYMKGIIKFIKDVDTGKDK